METDLHVTPEDLEIYARCTTEEDTQCLSDLCGHCPIPAQITKFLPRVRAEIEVQRMANTPAGFLAYCQTELTTHVKSAAQLANDMANPGKVPSSQWGQALGTKIWQLEVCKLYKAELVDISASMAPSQPAALSPALSPELAERLGHYADLLAACRLAEEPSDAASTLREAYNVAKGRGLYALEDFMKGLPLYVLAKLPAEQRESLNEGVIRSLNRHLKIYRQHPEAWPLWHVAQRERLLVRQHEVAKRLAVAEEGDRAEHQARAVKSWRDKHGDEAAAAVAKAQQKQLLVDVDTYRAARARLVRILAALDKAKAAGREEVRASELDGPATPVATALASAAEVAEPEQLLMAARPWAEIEAVAEKIGLRYRGDFTTKSNKTAAAGAGLIDALREADILPSTVTLPTLYAEFSEHYGRKIRADRMSDTRDQWQKKARQALGLDK